MKFRLLKFSSRLGNLLKGTILRDRISETFAGTKEYASTFKFGSKNELMFSQKETSIVMGSYCQLNNARFVFSVYYSE